jgi:hypothetical protein
MWNWQFRMKMAREVAMTASEPEMISSSTHEV